ncbi:MAG: DUF1016 family protein [Bacilli bacterium]|nr:DUF1016 family protein [Bacilli bacterium]
MEKELNEIITIIQSHKDKAYRKINEELVLMYFEIGKYLSMKIKAEKWGSKTIESISKNVMKVYPNLKGFNRAGLYRMVQFYEEYGDNIIVSTLSRQISWSNNILILSSTKSIEEKEFYLRLCIKHNYSYRELNRQISSGYYERYLLSGTDALESLTPAVDEDDIPKSKILDNYSLEFLDLPKTYSEKDLRKSIVSNLKDFILEIGNDFSFIGEEYRIQVGVHDFYIDLLFYNRTYSCLVAFELKIGEFKPEYISKMSFYLESLNRQEKKNNENQSVGIILCTSKDKTVVEYSVAQNNSNIAISTYETKLINKKLLENKIKEIREILNVDK